MSNKSTSPYSIRAKAPRAEGEGASAEVFIYGDIGESWWDETVTAKDFVKEIAALDVDRLTVRINSVGGSVPDGLAIYNALKRHKAAVTTCIDGMAMSIASLIAMAGDTVEMAENAILMIHAPWSYAAGNAVELRAQADVLDTWAAAMSNSYAAKTGHEQAAMLALLTDGVDHYYTATEAAAEGFIDAVVSALPIAASAVVTPAALARFSANHRRPDISGTPAASAAPTHQEPTMHQSQAPAAAVQQAAVAQKTEADIRAAALAADQQRRAQRPAQQRDGDEAGQRQQRAGGRPHHVAAQRGDQLDAGGDDQARGHRAHAAQRALRQLMVGHGGEQRRQHQHHAQRQHQHAGQRRQRAAQAEVAVADHHRQVDHVGAGHDLRHGPVLDELLAREPALFLDQLALHHRQHAAKALQRQPGERPKQIGRAARLGPRWRIVNRVQGRGHGFLDRNMPLAQYP